MHLKLAVMGNYTVKSIKGDIQGKNTVQNSDTVNVVVKVSAGFAVVNSVATFEMFYKAGFASTWWAMLTAPIGLILSLVAWVTYRLRETRCFTLAQFYEVRYSRKFRVTAGIITWISGVVNYGIFPMVSVKFLMAFCKLPDKALWLGINWDIYGILLAFCIGLGVFFAAFGGQIAIMVTDFLQGVICNIAFVIFIFPGPILSII